MVGGGAWDCSVSGEKVEEGQIGVGEGGRGFRRSAGRVLPRKAMRDVLSPTRRECAIASEGAKEVGTRS